MAGSSQIVSSQVNRHFSTLALMREKMRAGSRLHSDVQKAGRGRTLYVTHVYYTVFPSLLEYLYPQGLMGVHTGASRNCGSQSFPSCTHSTRYLIIMYGVLLCCTRTLCTVPYRHDVHARLTFFPGELLSEQMLLSSALGLPPLARWGVAV